VDELAGLEGQRYAALVEHVSELIGVVTPDGTVLFVNSALQRILGIDSTSLMASSKDAERLIEETIHPDDIERVVTLFETVCETGATSRPFEFRARHKDGSWRCLEAVLTNLIDDPAVGGVVVNAGDVTARKDAEALVRHHALHDPLTALPNRALFLDRLSVALARVHRRSNTLAVLLLDLDRFQTVNDSLGHAAGDELLAAVADRLRTVLRPGDTASRFTGDEFAILCDDLRRNSDAPLIATRVARSLSAPFLVDGREVFLTASIGIALAGNPPASAETLLRDAGAALHQAKSRGKDRFELFTENLRDLAIERLQTESALRRALGRNELTVHYQPEVDLRDSAVVGYEALVRWEHPERGLLAPADFVPVAEDTGLILPIGVWVLEQACRQAAQWPDAIRISVNLSARQLTDPSLLEAVTRVLRETALLPDRLCLEITESALMVDAEAAIEAVTALKLLGVRIGIDDFGTGYSSLSYLKRFPVDVLKVDRSFVHGLGVDEQDAALVAGVIHVAQALSLTTVAEGVETDEQRICLRSLGCETAQGYFFGRPTEPPSLPYLLSSTSSEPS
jgi:diguanylate cyclase (GGDEF)-like protein/PAS domain S-box-containing protein